MINKEIFLKYLMNGPYWIGNKIWIFLSVLFIISMPFFMGWSESNPSRARDLFDAPGQEIVSQYWIMGKNNVQRGTIRVHGFYRWYPFSKFFIWARNHGLEVCPDQKPFINNELRILSSEGLQLQLTGLRPEQSNFLCLDVAKTKLRFPGKQNTMGEYLDVLVYDTRNSVQSWRRLYRFTMGQSNCHNICLDINKFVYPAQKLRVKLAPSNLGGHYWGVYDMFILHDKSLADQQALGGQFWRESYSGWKKDLQK